MGLRLRRCLPAAVVVPLLLALALLPGPLGAQDASPSSGDSEPFSGTFYFQPSESADMDEVVDRGVSLVKSWLKRPFARGRIRETNRPYEWMQIFRVGGAVRVSTPAWTTDIPLGDTLRWEREEGDLVDVTMEWIGDAWLHRLEAEDGTRVNRFVLGPRGERLTLHVTIISDQLEAPLEYDLVYRRR